MTIPTWYLGPQGDLRALTAPERDISNTVERYGGTHQGLSGARTMDVTGHRATYEIGFKYLEQDEWDFLRRMHLRAVPGPFRLLDPFYTNRLTPESADCRVGGGTARGTTITGGNSIRTYDLPSGVTNLGGYSTKWFNRSGLQIMRWDLKNRITLQYSGEIVTGSVYIKGSSSCTGSFGFDWFDRDGAQLAGSATYTLNSGTGWGRYWVSARPPADAATCVMFYYTSDNTAELYFAYAKVEGATVPELAPSPTFEDGITGWTASSGSLANSTTLARSGSRSLRFTAPGDISGPEISASGIPVVVGKRYDLFGMVFSGAGWASGVRADIVWKNAANGTISTVTGSVVPLTAGVWTQVGAAGTAPALAVTAIIKYVVVGTPTVGATTNFDDVSFKDYFPDPTTWSMGGGAPVVFLDQMPTSSPRFPLTDVNITLLEA
jgi:uncharacterized protein YodC (DUF2158 family)